MHLVTETNRVHRALFNRVLHGTPAFCTRTPRTAPESRRPAMRPPGPRLRPVCRHTASGPRWLRSKVRVEGEVRKERGARSLRGTAQLAARTSPARPREAPCKTLALVFDTGRPPDPDQETRDSADDRAAMVVGKNAGSFGGTRTDSDGRRRTRRVWKCRKRQTLRDDAGLRGNSPDTHRAR